MNYKKKYEDALERAKMSYHTGVYDKDTLEMLEIIFPELKESEDERIRKAIVNAIHNYAYRLGEKIPTEWLDWLEKQGEQKASYTTLVETGDGGINALVTKELHTDGKQKPEWTEEDDYNLKRFGINHL